MKWNFSRRSLLKGAAGLGAAAAVDRFGGGLGQNAFAQTAQKSAVLVVFLRGGYNALYADGTVRFLPENLDERRLRESVGDVLWGWGGRGERPPWPRLR